MEFDTPSPQQRTGHDYSKNPIKDSIRIDYKTGKLETASVKMFFDGKLDPEYQVQGFHFWDKELMARIGVKSFTAYVLGIYSGSFSNGKDKGDVRYFSNLVNDTRTDIIQSSYWGVGRSYQFALGNYKNDIVPAFESLIPKRGSTYTKVLVAYVAERKEICVFHLNATMEAGLVKAVARARGIEEYKASLFGLSDIKSEVWVFQFKGEFEPVSFTPKDAKKVPATVAAKKEDNVLYFQPIFEAGVLRLENPKYTERVASINAMEADLSEYIASEQAHLKAVMGKLTPDDSGFNEDEAQHIAGHSQAVPQRGGNGFQPIVNVPFPNEEPPMGENESDDLPF